MSRTRWKLSSAEGFRNAPTLERQALAHVGEGAEVAIRRGQVGSPGDCRAPVALVGLSPPPDSSAAPRPDGFGSRLSKQYAVRQDLAVESRRSWR
jgi:hypothetical protein